MTMPAWTSQGSLGTQAWQDEAKFMKFLASVYGSWILAAGYRGIYSFQKDNSPLYQWWVTNGKPNEASGYKEAIKLAEKEEPLWKNPEKLSTLMYDTTKEPYPPPAGKKWQVSQYNEQGVPIQPMWTLVDETTGAVEPATTFGGRSAEEWALGVPQFEWQKQQAELKAKQDKRDWMAGEQAKGNAYLKSMADREAAIAMQNTAFLQNVITTKPEREAQVQRERKAALAEEFERVRAQAIQSFQPQARDWVSLYKAQSTPNPFASQEITGLDRIAEAEIDAKSAESAYKLAQQIEKAAASDPNRSLSSAEKTQIDLAKSRWESATHRLLEMQLARGQGAQTGLRGETPQTEAAARFPEQVEEGRWITPRPTGFGNFAVGEPGTMEPQVNTMPVIPDWLQSVSGLSGRVPETRTGIPSPSGQMWNRLAPTQQQMYAGLVDWAGSVPFEDAMNTMRVSTPKSLTLGRTWSPARQ